MTEMTDERALDFIRTYFAPYAARGEKDLVVEHIAARLRAAPQPPAEAQPVAGKLLSEGGAGCHDCDGYQAEGVFCPTCGTTHREPPPSAPGREEGLAASLRDARERMISALGPKLGEAFDGDFDVMRAAADTLSHLKRRSDAARGLLARRLAQQPAAVSEVTRQLIERDRKGREKYGVTLDRRDLSVSDWLQHMAEELMDAAGYALAAKRESEHPAAAISNAGTSESRFIASADAACTACGGSGHRDDQQPAAVDGVHDPSHAWPAVDRVLTDAYSAGADGHDFDLIAARRALAGESILAQQPALSAPVGITQEASSEAYPLYVQNFGEDARWLGEFGSGFVHGVRAGRAAAALAGQQGGES